MENKISFDKFFKNISSKPYQISKDKYLDEGLYPIVDQGQKYIVGYSNDNSKLYKINHPIIIFGDHTRIIKYIDFDFIVGADGTKILYTDNTVHIKYAYYQLLHTKIESLGYSRHYKLLKEKEFIKHPLDQQKQIAKTLDKANELIELRTESIKKLDALAKSIFIDMFGDPVSNPKKWEIRRITDLGKVQTGNTPPRADLDNYGNFIEWIKSDNILKDNITVAKSREYLSEKGYAKGRIVKSGSLLFTCIAGSMSSIGNLAITDREVTFNQQINSLTPFENNELYLYSLFKLSKKIFEENSTKSMKIMINKSTFENLFFPIAPLALQNKFAKIIEKIEEQKTLYTQELEKLQENFDALLQKSFQE
jgi:type I restriction enzyme, S subunit